ncbi:hypothetical protein Tco_0164897, partial [Tanacetum coccineum]
VPIRKYNRVLKRQKKLRNQISSALTASADVPSSVTETTDTTSTLPPPPPPLQKSVHTSRPIDKRHLQNVVPTVEKTDSSHKWLEFLFNPLLKEYCQAEENNINQAPNASFQEDEFINPFCTRVQEIGESSSRNIDNTDVHLFQPQSHDYRDGPEIIL